ncbi:MAG: hypothetical protein U1E51_25215 [Candidatus Binatia bacterium]|nr:hypothetical protein [Candidatus Binatia bacterium]
MTKFKPTTWQHKFAVRFAKRLKEFGCLHAEVARAPKDKLEGHLQKWADTLDKLERIDGHSQDTITSVLKWLLREDNWWINTKNVRSAAKFRDKNSDGEKYFDVMLAQMTAKRKKPNADLSQPITTAQTHEVIAHFGLLESDFYAKGQNWKGDKLFMLRPEKRKEMGL